MFGTQVHKRNDSSAIKPLNKTSVSAGNIVGSSAQRDQSQNNKQADFGLAEDVIIPDRSGSSKVIVCGYFSGLCVFTIIPLWLVSVCFWS